MTGSFALSIMMILSFSVLVQWVQMALNPLQPWAPDVFYSSPDNPYEIEKSFAQEIASLPYVKRPLDGCTRACPQNTRENRGRLI